jgi:2,5-diamino-6-(ribosylamino)-4(3H)-pyrimidinone 5'-phosphate reductase
VGIYLVKTRWQLLVYGIHAEKLDITATRAATLILANPFKVIFSKFMYKSLLSCRDRIYDFDELSFPNAGVSLEVSGDSLNDVIRPYVIFNMVSSIDGKATTFKGELGKLGSRPDRYLMKRLRSQVDGVIAGANTLRYDAFIPTLPDDLVADRLKNFEQPQPLGIVITNSGNLPENHRFWDAGQDLRLVITTEDTAIAPWVSQKAQILRLPSQAQNQAIDLQKVLTILWQQFGIKRLLVEGGASLNYSLISQHLIDEIFLSIAPYLVGGVENMSIIGGSGYGLGSGEIPKLKLRSVYSHDSELFLRYSVTTAY